MPEHLDASGDQRNDSLRTETFMKTLNSISICTFVTLLGVIAAQGAPAAERVKTANGVVAVSYTHLTLPTIYSV